MTLVVLFMIFTSTHSVRINILLFIKNIATNSDYIQSPIISIKNDCRYDHIDYQQKNFSFAWNFENYFDVKTLISSGRNISFPICTIFKG